MGPSKLEHLVTESLDVCVKVPHYVRTRCLYGLVKSMLRTTETPVGSITAPSQTQTEAWRPRVRNCGCDKGVMGQPYTPFRQHTLIAKKFLGRTRSERYVASCHVVSEYATRPPAHRKKTVKTARCNSAGCHGSGESRETVRTAAC